MKNKKNIENPGNIQKKTGIRERDQKTGSSRPIDGSPEESLEQCSANLFTLGHTKLKKKFHGTLKNIIVYLKAKRGLFYIYYNLKNKITLMRCMTLFL